jgi:hypothetical protein
LFIIIKNTSKYLKDAYQLSPDSKPVSVILRRLLGIPPLPKPISDYINYPFILVKEPKLDKGHPARWLGGPFTLVLYDGIAAYLDRCNRFSRVVGPGLPMTFLDRYERIKEIIDLKPQIKTGYVMPWTKDGIRIKLTIRAECQINASPEAREKSSKFQYPFDPLAVKAAVERMTVRVDPNTGELIEASWLDGAWGSVTGAINAFVAGHTLDELFFAQKIDVENELETSVENVGSLEQIFSKRFADEKLGDVNRALAQNGVKVLGIQITKCEMLPYKYSDEIVKMRIKYWESAQERVAALRNSRAEADRIRAREQAHAEAQRTLLMTIIQSLERLDPESLTEPLLLSLSGLIDQSLDDPIVRPMIAKEAFAVLDRVRNLLRERF